MGGNPSVCILVRSKVVSSEMKLMELYLEAWIFLWTCVCFSYEQVVVDSAESTTFEVPLGPRLYIHGIQFSNHNQPEIYLLDLKGPGPSLSILFKYFKASITLNTTIQQISSEPIIFSLAKPPS
jgi:hypothetical protein